MIAVGQRVIEHRIVRFRVVDHREVAVLVQHHGIVVSAGVAHGERLAVGRGATGADRGGNRVRTEGEVCDLDEEGLGLVERVSTRT